MKTSFLQRSAASSLHDASKGGFTLLEALLAMFIFSMAGIALVQVINLSGLASIEARRREAIVSQLETQVLEFTRNPPKELAGVVDGNYSKKFKDNSGVEYAMVATPLQLKNEDGALVSGLFSLKASAHWMESGHAHDIGVETWFYPPLYANNNMVNSGSGIFGTGSLILQGNTNLPPGVTR